MIAVTLGPNVPILMAVAAQFRSLPISISDHDIISHNHNTKHYFLIEVDAIVSLDSLHCEPDCPNKVVAILLPRQEVKLLGTDLEDVEALGSSTMINFNRQQVFLVSSKGFTRTYHLRTLEWRHPSDLMHLGTGCGMCRTGYSQRIGECTRHMSVPISHVPEISPSFEVDFKGKASEPSDILQ